MRSRMRRRIAAFALAAVSALTIVGATAASASALVRGHAAHMSLGRGGVFPVPSSSGVDIAALIGGLAISAAMIALVTWVALRADNGSRVRLAVAPGGTSVDGGRPVSTEDHERKAA